MRIIPNRKKEFPSELALAAGVGVGYILMLNLLRMRRRMNFRGKSVVITGGSRGLGLEMARQLAAEGANLALLARNEPELRQAQLELHRAGAQVMIIPTDVTDRHQVFSAIRQVADTYGGVDVLINNAGLIQVSPVNHLKLEDYEDAMDVHFWGPLYAMLAVIPYMRQQGGGRIINIASIVGLVAVPHMAPYAASKFALEGLSDAFRAELARDNILVSTINPGLMRTGSYYHGNYKGQQEKEFAWFSLLASSPLVAMSSRRAARQVVQTARYGIPERTLTFQARILQLVEELAPNVTAWVMKTVNRTVLPAPTDLKGEEIKTGFESRSNKLTSKLTQLGEKAAERNNELIAERGS